MWGGLHIKYSLFLSDFKETWIFSTEFRRKLKYKVSSESAHWLRSCSIRTDGHEADSHFSQLHTFPWTAAPVQTNSSTCWRGKVESTIGRLHIRNDANHMNTTDKFYMYYLSKNPALKQQLHYQKNPGFWYKNHTEKMEYRRNKKLTEQTTQSSTYTTSKNSWYLRTKKNRKSDNVSE